MTLMKYYPQVAAAYECLQRNQLALEGTVEFPIVTEMTSSELESHHSEYHKKSIPTQAEQQQYDESLQFLFSDTNDLDLFLNITRSEDISDVIANLF